MHCSASSWHMSGEGFVSHWSLQVSSSHLIHISRPIKTKMNHLSPKWWQFQPHTLWLSLWHRCHLSNMPTAFTGSPLSCHKKESFTGTPVPSIANLQLAAESNKVLKLTFSNLFFSSTPLRNSNQGETKLKRWHQSDVGNTGLNTAKRNQE